MFTVISKHAMPSHKRPIAPMAKLFAGSVIILAKRCWGTPAFVATVKSIQHKEKHVMMPGKQNLVIMVLQYAIFAAATDWPVQ